MNIVFTCGGTGGHIYPAIAVARMFRERQPDCGILFNGAEAGMANQLVPREGCRPTKLVARTASRVMVSFESSREHYPEPEKVLLTGTPVREEFLFAKRQEARQALGLGEEPLVVSCWGSLGAREMNKKIAQFMKCECEDNTPFHHIHATSSIGWR